MREDAASADEPNSNRAAFSIHSIKSSVPQRPQHRLTAPSGSSWPCQLLVHLHERLKMIISAKRQHRILCRIQRTWQNFFTCATATAAATVAFSIAFCTLSSPLVYIILFVYCPHTFSEPLCAGGRAKKVEGAFSVRCIRMILPCSTFAQVKHVQYH